MFHILCDVLFMVFFFNDPETTEIYTLSLHDALPILRRIWTGSTPGAYTSAPSTRTVPVTRAPGTTSCIRFRQRMNVDLPQPDGPMSAGTAFGTIEMPISCST